MSEETPGIPGLSPIVGSVSIAGAFLKPGNIESVWLEFREDGTVTWRQATGRHRGDG